VKKLIGVVSNDGWLASGYPAVVAQWLEQLTKASKFEDSILAFART